MISEVIKNSLPFLPLLVESVDWTDPTLNLIGKNWSFLTVSSWRLISRRKLECGCYDKKSSEIVQQLKLLLITQIECQSSHLQTDPVFTFSNGWKLEVFSTTYYEPWVFNFSSGTIYVASPADPNEVD